MIDLETGAPVGSSERSSSASCRTGRRRVTQQQIAATARLTGQFAAVPRWRVRATFEAGGIHLGLSDKAVELVRVLMGFSFDVDWDGVGRPLVWPSNLLLRELLRIGQSRLNAVIREVIDAGLILAHDHGTRNRHGQRDEKTGRIVYAFGFDLSPLAERMMEFEQAAAESNARLAEARLLAREASGLRAMLLDLVSYGIEQMVPSMDWEDLSRQTEKLSRRARRLNDPTLLVPIIASLKALKRQADAAVQAAILVETGSAVPEMRNPNTSTNTFSIANALANDGNRPAKQSRSGSERSSSTERIRQTSSALRGFPISPIAVLQIAPSFRDFVGSANPAWSEIQEAATYVRSRLGISPHAYGQACVVLGRIEAATAIAAIAAKHDAGLIRSPGGLLRHMVDAHQNSSLRLDRTLFGLLDARRRSPADSEDLSALAPACDLASGGRRT